MSLTGKIIAVTGKLSMSRKEITKLIEDNGGIFVSTITKKVTHLVCPNPDSTEDGEKLKKAKAMGIEIVGEDFLSPYSTGATQSEKQIQLKVQEPIKKKVKVEKAPSTQLQINSKVKSKTISPKETDKTIEEFTTFIEKMTSSNSNLEKGSNFKAFMSKASADFTEILQLIYNEQMKFGITSKNVVKFEETKYDDSHYVNMKLVDFIKQLVETDLTGHNALKVAVSFLNDYPEHRDTLLSIFDKDLKIRFGLKSVNAIIPDFVPEFNVSLGNPYNDKTKKHVESGDWYISRKLDGVRCITLVKVQLPFNDDANRVVIECYSRGGLQFSTLQKVKDEIRNNLANIIPHIVDLPNAVDEENMLKFVFDGEMCVIRSDGSEDYKTIVSEIKRKNKTVENPRYLVFDLLTYSEFKNGLSTKERTFNERLKILKQFLPSYSYNKTASETASEEDSKFAIIKLLPQLPFTEEMFLMMSEQAEKHGWEGLMLRKDAEYCGDRSNDILKVKRFETEEYEVQDLVFGEITVINEGSGLQEKIDTMVSVIINHTGMNVNTGELDVNQINVGSGFSQQERQMFYKNPDLIKGKTISVQFFEKTNSKDGKESLRFPTFKGLHGKKRVI
jgi:DNA ligase 1